MAADEGAPGPHPSEAVKVTLSSETVVHSIVNGPAPTLSPSVQETSRLPTLKVASPSWTPLKDTSVPRISADRASELRVTEQEVSEQSTASPTASAAELAAELAELADDEAAPVSSRTDVPVVSSSPEHPATEKSSTAPVANAPRVSFRACVVAMMGG
jgi:uncharacterized protein (UPF0147 family)